MRPYTVTVTLTLAWPTIDRVEELRRFILHLGACSCDLEDGLVRRRHQSIRKDPPHSPETIMYGFADAVFAILNGIVHNLEWQRVNRMMARRRPGVRPRDVGYIMALGRVTGNGRSWQL